LVTWRDVLVTWRDSAEHRVRARTRGVDGIAAASSCDCCGDVRRDVSVSWRDVSVSWCDVTHAPARAASTKFRNCNCVVLRLFAEMFRTDGTVPHLLLLCARRQFTSISICGALAVYANVGDARVFSQRCFVTSIGKIVRTLMTISWTFNLWFLHVLLLYAEIQNMETGNSTQFFICIPTPTWLTNITVQNTSITDIREHYSTSHITVTVIWYTQKRPNI